VDRLISGLDEIAAPDWIVRLRPSGALPVPDREALAKAVEALRPRFAALELDLAALRLVADGDHCDLPLDLILREVHQRLLRLANDPSDGLPERFPKKTLPEPDASVIARALIQFRSLLH
jgi:hypothetical protein